ncbi:outer arm dynein light chain 1, partial [Reticulomyxa filosa]
LVDEEEKLSELDGAHVAQLFPHLNVLNIGDNLIEDWNAVVSTFGELPALVKLQCSFANLTRIFYSPKKFEQLQVLWARNNKINSLDTFDELNKFPKLSQLLIIENPLAKEYGEMTVRDLLIAK